MRIPIRHLLTLALCAAAPFAHAAAKPNVIFILADDLGWMDTGVYGSTYYETPNIDRLAAQGVRFTNHHNCQNCAPSRAAMMSGQYAPRTGIYTVGGINRFNWPSRPLRPVDNITELPLDRATIATQLKATGYATAMFGKWHLGIKRGHHPSQRGFDEAIVSEGKHFDFDTNPPVEYPKGAYLADWLTDKAVDFIHRKKDEPFFLYLPHFAVHEPLQAKQDMIERFKPKPGVGHQENPTYAAMVASVDESVGRILAALDELKLAERTVVIFSSDNGGVGVYDFEGVLKPSGVTDNAPLRGAKAQLYEGGVRDPLIVRWPGVTKPGSVCNEPTIHVDLYPTVLEITGAPQPTHVLDGESWVKLLRDPSARLARDAIYQHFPGYLGAGDTYWRSKPVGTIQCRDWKLMEFFEDSRLELYNLRDDLGETNNLALKMPEKAKELHDKMLAWRTAIHAPMPTPNTNDTSNVKIRASRKKRKAAAE